MKLEDYKGVAREELQVEEAGGARGFGGARIRFNMALIGCDRL